MKKTLTIFLQSYSLLRIKTKYHLYLQLQPNRKKLFVNALKAVGANQRIALALNLLCDYDAKKIADVLKISEDKVQNSLDYGRENVKKQLRLSNGNFSKRDIVFLMTASSDIVKSAAAQKKTFRYCRKSS